MDLSKINQKKFLIPLLMLSVLVLAAAALNFSSVSTGSLLDSVTQKNSSNGDQIVKVEKTVAAANQGSHTFYYVYLKNGSRIMYDYYQSNHPLCPEQPEKCGEDSKDPGWNEINQKVNSNSFKLKEETGKKVYKPVEPKCLDTKISITNC